MILVLMLAGTAGACGGGSHSASKPLGNAADVRAKEAQQTERPGTLGVPVRLDTSVSITVKAISAQKIPDPIGGGATAPVAAVRIDNRSNSELSSLDVSVECTPQPKPRSGLASDAGGMLAYSTVGLKPIPSGSFEEGNVWFFFPGQSGSGTPFPGCDNARLMLTPNLSSGGVQPKVVSGSWSIDAAVVRGVHDASVKAP